MNNLSIKSNSINDLTQKIIYNYPSDNATPSNSSSKKTLRIIHFNDVYNIEPDTREPLGGAARFLTAINIVKSEEPCLVLFSGDAFSPSTRNAQF
jgi:2',3'-cyclic-nucleotide 2'-phosphodiesterase (5'-nucleotidase family)